MGLDAYKEKRRFDKTPEPRGGRSQSEKLVFVVQKHHASHLHYDFRLELKGVLKSWAVPKGPSMNPQDHRLAQAVEDHPFDYKDFEGIIPQGQYGGGSVIIWDQGTYEPIERIKGKKAQEHYLMSEYYSRGLAIRLHGKKLKGQFLLVRMPERGANSWILNKVADSYARKTDITEKDKSVISGLTVDQVAKKKNSRVWNSNRRPGSDDKEVREIDHSGESSDGKIKILSANSNWRKIADQKITSSQEFEIDGEQLALTNVEHNIWKDVPKAELITYYHSISRYILPYLKNRPLSLHIKNNGAVAPGFYIKDMEGNEPAYASIFHDHRRHKQPGKREVIDYIVCNNEPTLLFLVNLGCIDFNPWSSQFTSINYPDFISVDLDPSDEDFDKAIETALAAKKLFDEMKLKSLIKTSGKTGLHLFLPCDGIEFKKARWIAEFLCSQIVGMVPEISTTEVTISHRGSKLFVDPSQNDYADTLASVYSVRPHKIPSVSTPLTWREVKYGLYPGDFNMANTFERIEKRGDLFKDLFNIKWRKSNSKVFSKLLAGMNKHR